MRFLFITNVVSPHQVPLARALAELFGTANFRYIAETFFDAERSLLGWSADVGGEWVLFPKSSVSDARMAATWISDADIVFCGLRNLDHFERRCREEKITIYMSERWFKPPYGMLRLLHPSYLRMAFRFCRLLRSPRFYYLPMGVPAAKDMLRMVRLFARFPRWLFREPLITAEELSPKLLLWGYFVEPAKIEKPLAGTLGAKRVEAVGNRQSAVGSGSTNALMNSRTHELLRVLWVGRMLNWKRVDTLIKAVGQLLGEGRKIRLTIIGQGPEEVRLRKLADKILKKFSASGMPSGLRPPAYDLDSRQEPPITFHPPVPIAQVRDFMRQADVYVLPSDGGEGWGAVVNEAMGEGCAVIATHECGAGATMIREGQNGLLFRAGDVNALAKGLRRMQDEPEMRQELANDGRVTVRQIWGPDVAAERLVAFCQAVLDGQPCPRYSDGPLSEALG